MIANRRVSNLLIGVSLAIALLLTMLPAPPWLESVRPALFVSTVLFWVLMQPQRFGITCAWVCGILLDVIYGTPLTQHGLALALAAYLIVKFRELLWIIPHWQQPLLLLPIFLVYEFILFWMDGIMGFEVEPLRRWSPILTSAIVWPFLAFLLERIAEMDVRY